METRIILELCCNHQGSKQIAKRMIDEAVELNCWGVKFQKRDIESMPEEQKSMPRNSGNSFGPTYYEHRKALEFDTHEMLELKKYAEKKGLKAIVSVFDMVSAKEMVDIGFEYVKLPSQLYTNIKMVKFLGKSDSKLIGSTGMHTLNEIKHFHYNYQYDIIMFCRSIYPCNLQEISFGNFTALQKMLDWEIIDFGYSSHDQEGQGIKYAVVLGAKYIERHYTLDKTWKGSDHSISSDFEEMKKIIKEIEFIEKYINVRSFELSEKEKKVRKRYRGF